MNLTSVSKAGNAAKEAAAAARETVGRTQRIYGTTLLTRGLVWVAVIALSRWLLEIVDGPSARVIVALLPVPVFAWFLWAWVSGLARMDELERRIELEALAFAFPISVAFFATIGLLDVALPVEQYAFGIRGAWLMMPMLYYVGLWRAQRRYR